MKPALLTLLSLGTLAAAASAHDRDRHECYDGSRKYHHHRHCEVPVRKVCTEVIDTETYCERGINHCGKPFVLRVKFVTYRDVYSDGSTRVYRIKRVC